MNTGLFGRFKHVFISCKEFSKNNLTIVFFKMYYEWQNDPVNGILVIKSQGKIAANICMGQTCANNHVSQSCTMHMCHEHVKNEHVKSAIDPEYVKMAIDPGQYLT